MSNADVSLVTVDPDGDDVIQWLRRDLGVESFGINLIVLRPGQRLRVHTHDRQEEVYAVLEGELGLLVEGEPVAVPRWTLARVPAGVRRQLTNRGPAKVVVLALGGDGEHDPRDARAWADWEEPGDGRPPKEVPLPEDLPPEERAG